MHYHITHTQNRCNMLARILVVTSMCIACDTYFRFETSAHICLCLSEEILKAGGPFYRGSMPGGVKDLTQGVNM